MVPAESYTSFITSKGQVSIPKALRQQMGLFWGIRISFQLVGDPIEVRPCKPPQPLQVSGFGLLSTRRPPVPAEFDPSIRPTVEDQPALEKAVAPFEHRVFAPTAPLQRLKRKRAPVPLGSAPFPAAAGPDGGFSLVGP